MNLWTYELSKKSNFWPLLYSYGCLPTCSSLSPLVFIWYPLFWGTIDFSFSPYPVSLWLQLAVMPSLVPRGLSNREQTQETMCSQNYSVYTSVSSPLIYTLQQYMRMPFPQTLLVSKILYKLLKCIWTNLGANFLEGKWWLLPVLFPNAHTTRKSNFLSQCSHSPQMPPQGPEGHWGGHPSC
jgi:hypothetical protein